ncbi:MAG TPA: carbohydrate ABC transporter permease [Sphaerochaeta sp.]|jgi:putative aldouronate transport system permease protein|nr:carbohydrate ABC transporter permease [Sphaerochaeta sp.]HPZ15755.1 carbohydrate ABC transporter permease [Sphaerochaeta sp.]
MAVRRSKGETIFLAVNYLVMALLCLSMLFPFWSLLAKSFAAASVPSTQLYFWPSQTTLANYARVFANKNIWIGFGNTIFRTVVGTILSLVMSIHVAYPLSKKYLPNRTFWTSLIVFTMFFSGGMIPEYILVRSLKLYNSRWALIFPILLNTFNMIIIRNYFMSIPDSLEESAKIDGANDLLILYRIIIPLSFPIIATVVLWTAVSHWNAWFDSLIYISDGNKQVLQTILRRIVLEGSLQLMELQGGAMAMEASNVSSEAIKAATVIVATTPILVAYPFLQKYFVKGVLVGSLKG